MNSQLNPNAAVFIPVSPTRLLMMDDAIISASSGVTIEETAVLNLEYGGGPKYVDYFMRDNFSTIPNKIKELTSVTADVTNTEKCMEHISIDQLLGIQNITQKDVNNESGETNLCKITATSIDIDSDDGSNISANNNTSTIGDFVNDKLENSEHSDTTTSLKVEVSCFTITEENPHISYKADNELTQYDLTTEKVLCSDVILPENKPQKVLSVQRKKTKSSRKKNKKRSGKVETNVTEKNEGFITEHRKTPPINLTFKPLQTFSDTNPFGALQTPSTTTPLDEYYNLAELYKSPQDTSKEGEALCKPEINEKDFTTNPPLYFISSRSPIHDNAVPFEELESPNEIPDFVHPPNSNRMVSVTELSKSFEIKDIPENMPFKSLEHTGLEIDSVGQENFTETKQDLIDGVSSSRKQEISFISENSRVNKMLSNIYLNTAKQLLRPEYTISQPEKECEQTSKLDIDLHSTNDAILQEDNDNILRPKVEQIFPVLSSIKADEPCEFDIFMSSNSETSQVKIDADHKQIVDETLQDLFDEESNHEMQETSFTDVNVELMGDTSKKDVLNAESLITHQKKCFDPTLNIDDSINTYSETMKPTETFNTSLFKGLDRVKRENDDMDSNYKKETREMILELEANSPNSETTPEEIRNLVQDFEVINKDELIKENYLIAEKATDTSGDCLKIESEKEVVEIYSTQSETLLSILKMDDTHITAYFSPSSESVSAENNKTSNSDSSNTTDKFIDAENLKSDDSKCPCFVEEAQKSNTETTVSSSVKEYIYQSEETNSFQMLDSVAENRQSVTEGETPCLMEMESSPDTVYAQSDLVQSMTGTLEEVEKVPTAEIKEVPLVVRTALTTSTPTKLNPQDQPGIDISMTASEIELKLDSRAKPIEKEMERDTEEFEKHFMSEFSDTMTKQLTQLDTPITLLGPVVANTTTSVKKPASEAKTTTYSATTGKISIVKSTAPSTALTKLVTSGSCSARPATKSLSTSKTIASGASASKISASNVMISKPASSADPSKPVSQRATPKSTSSSVAPSKSATFCVTSSNTVSSSGMVVQKSSAPIPTSSKTSTTSITSSKPVVSSVAPSKPMAISKHAASSSTVDPCTTPPKPTATTTVARKPATSTVKLNGTKTMTTTTPSIKSTVTSTSSKSVLKQQPISETINIAPKSPSKPSTPTSNTTSLTTPKPPMNKTSAVKSPSKPEAKSPLPSKSITSSKLTMDKSSDKKPSATTEIKPLVKKGEATKNSTTVTSKLSTSTNSSTPGAKAVTSVTKPQTPSLSKSAVNTTKQKPVGALDESSNVSGVKKSAVVSVAKTTEKSSKESASRKTSANGKTAPTKTPMCNETDPNDHMKNSDKFLGKKPGEENKEEKSVQMQGVKILTSNEIEIHSKEQ